jgi:putative GTP pyrophosphokinase
MKEKIARKGLPLSAQSALRELKDAIGIRIVCRFIDDIYTNLEAIRQLPFCRILQEKDYITNVKPNGYRSYHVIRRNHSPL